MGRCAQRGLELSLESDEGSALCPVGNLGRFLSPWGREVKALCVLAQPVTTVSEAGNLQGFTPREMCNMPYLWAWPLAVLYLFFSLLLQVRELSAVCRAFTA